MKIAAKESLCIYTNFSHHHEVDKKMENLSQELEKTKNLLKMQKNKYYKLISLFAIKLNEKEAEFRKHLQLKHDQLNHVLKALYTLEGKIRKSGKIIQIQLQEKDCTINELKHKITQLQIKLLNQQNNNNNNNNNNNTIITSQDQKIITSQPDLITSICYGKLIEDEKFTENIQEIQKNQSEISENENSIKEAEKFNQIINTEKIKEKEILAIEIQENSKFSKNGKIEDKKIEKNSQLSKNEKVEEKNEIQKSPEISKNFEKLKIEISEYKDTPRKCKNPPPVPKKLIPKISESTKNNEIQKLDEKNNENCEKEINNNSEIVKTVSAVLSEPLESDSDEVSEIEELSPSTVSQMVKKFECLGSSRINKNNNLNNNFEEFYLIDKEIDTTCEIKKMELNNNNEKYENFLEKTGLSQKSIITPSRANSRALNNHRNVIKPKDVKHKSKIRSEKSTSIVKYWTEPYL